MTPTPKGHIAHFRGDDNISLFHAPYSQDDRAVWRANKKKRKKESSVLQFSTQNNDPPSYTSGSSIKPVSGRQRPINITGRGKCSIL